ncbi:MAG: hypothetical protein M3P51_06995 [Chloroflexota bacterium]|nr:hypothetical protein [Chloroflexota bacterium]
MSRYWWGLSPQDCGASEDDVSDSESNPVSEAEIEEVRAQMQDPEGYARWEAEQRREHDAFLAEQWEGAK